MKYIASCSFGKDSLAMVLKLIELGYPLDEIVYFDMGVEFPSIRNNAEKLKKQLDGKVQFTILEPEKPFMYYMLDHVYTRKDGSTKKGYDWCGKRCVRYGTSLKLKAIHENNKKYKNEIVVEYVGVAANEQDRLIRGRVKSCSNRISLYPLAEWGMTEKDCLDYCYSKGWTWEYNGVDLYKILNRVSCWCCSNKNLKELRNMYHFLPEIWQQLRELQLKIKQPFRPDYNIFELEEKFKKEDSGLLFNPGELELSSQGKLDN